MRGVRGSKEEILRGKYGMPGTYDGFSIPDQKRKAIAYHAEYAINHEQGHRLLAYINDVSGILNDVIKEWLDEQGLPHRIY